jgi:hypothetical protein
MSAASAFGAPESFVDGEAADLEPLEQAPPATRERPTTRGTARRSPDDGSVITSSIALTLAFAI